LNNRAEWIFLAADQPEMSAAFFRRFVIRNS
jgi:hypothetical protein